MQPPALNDSLAVADHRKWLVCGMLLLSLVLNYMDRQTLSLTITAIEQEIGLNNTQYGRLEKGFGYAFAIGAVAFGMIADQVSIRWLYPLVLLGWSAAGLATGYADRLGAWLAPQLTQFVDLRALSLGSEEARSDIELSEASLTAYLGFFVCRVVLGFFESGLWPCALITTQRLLSRGDRPLGNSILQSGASLGAILTPVVVGAFAPAVAIAESTTAAEVVSASAGWWRSPFVVIGALGLLWIGPWFWIVSGLDLSRPPVRRDEIAGKPQGISWGDRLVFARRFIARLFSGDRLVFARRFIARLFSGDRLVFARRF
ncbi:MAG: MFS transporter, partial [Pirellulaceae bacterium]